VVGAAFVLVTSDERASFGEQALGAVTLFDNDLHAFCHGVLARHISAILLELKLAASAVAGLRHIRVSGHVAVELIIVSTATLGGVLALLAHFENAVTVVSADTRPAERYSLDDVARLACADALVRDRNSRSRSRGRGGEGSLHGARTAFAADEAVLDAGSRGVKGLAVGELVGNSVLVAFSGRGVFVGGARVA